MLRYDQNLKGKARQLRKNTTDSEKALWSRLRGKQMLGVQFYRQKPIGDYVVDFYAPRAKLVVEIDGSQHLQNGALERDRKRDLYLASLGLKVMRFNSREVIMNTDGVVEAVYRRLEAMLSD
jgi:very-short-patch-repair endonuclease